MRRLCAGPARRVDVSRETAPGVMEPAWTEPGLGLHRMLTAALAVWRVHVCTCAAVNQAPASGWLARVDVSRETSCTCPDSLKWNLASILRKPRDVLKGEGRVHARGVRYWRWAHVAPDPRPARMRGGPVAERSPDVVSLGVPLASVRTALLSVVIRSGNQRSGDGHPLGVDLPRWAARRSCGLVPRVGRPRHDCFRAPDVQRAGIRGIAYDVGCVPADGGRLQGRWWRHSTADSARRSRC